MDSGFVHVDGSAWAYSWLAGVSMVLGSTPLTVTPDPLSSSASTLINASSLDLETYTQRRRGTARPLPMLPRAQCGHSRFSAYGATRLSRAGMRLSHSWSASAARVPHLSPLSGPSQSHRPIHNTSIRPAVRITSFTRRGRTASSVTSAFIAFPAATWSGGGLRSTVMTRAPDCAKAGVRPSRPTPASSGDQYDFFVRSHCSCLTISYSRRSKLCIVVPDGRSLDDHPPPKVFAGQLDHPCQVETASRRRAPIPR